MATTVFTAFTIGRRGRAGAAVGAFFSLVAVATMARIALVAAHGDKIPAVKSALPWLPTISWLAAAVLLVPLVWESASGATAWQPRRGVSAF